MDERIFLWTKEWLKKNHQPFSSLNKTASSNDWAKLEAFKKELPSQIFLVREQSQGRGRGDSLWQNSDLMISFLWEESLRKIQALSALDFTKDLKEALNLVFPQLPLQIKEPNDLYLSGRKTAGILLEVLSQGEDQALIVGLGLNVFSHPESFTCLSRSQDIEQKHWGLFLQKLIFLWNQRAFQAVA